MGEEKPIIIESDGDEQMLIRLVFKCRVDLQSLDFHFGTKPEVKDGEEEEIQPPSVIQVVSNARPLMTIRK